MSNKYYDLTYLSLQVNTIIVLTLFIIAMNIILVLVDSLNKSALKTYNPETICETPNLEEFAKKSLIFENHYISCPWSVVKITMVLSHSDNLSSFSHK